LGIVVHQAALAWREGIGFFSGSSLALQSAAHPSSNQPDLELAISRGLTWRSAGRRRVTREIAA